MVSHTVISLRLSKFKGFFLIVSICKVGGQHLKLSPKMAMDQYLYIPFLGLFTSINPSYFGFTARYQGFDQHAWRVIPPGGRRALGASSLRRVFVAQNGAGRARCVKTHGIPCSSHQNSWVKMDVNNPL